MLHYLRIAAAITCFVICAAIAILWMRSYRHCDSFAASTPSVYFFYASSDHGKFQIQLGDGRLMEEARWEFGTRPAPTESVVDRTQGINGLGFQWRVTGPPGFPVYNSLVPHWFPALVSGIAGTLLWMKRPYRFTVRGALIATMIVAAVMGTGVALSR